jgi:hypothetical protein
MSQRITFDRHSLEQVLAAASFVQQWQRQEQVSRAAGNDDSQLLPLLVEVQQAIETGQLDLEAAMNRIVELRPEGICRQLAVLFSQPSWTCPRSFDRLPSTSWISGGHGRRLLRLWYWRLCSHSCF